VVGNETRVKVVKNKVSPPFKQAEFQIMYNQGINHNAEIIDLGVKLGLVDKAGAWYAYKGDKIGQGKSNSCKFLVENPAIADEIEKQIRSQLLTIQLPEEIEAAKKKEEDEAKKKEAKELKSKEAKGKAPEQA